MSILKIAPVFIVILSTVMMCQKASLKQMKTQIPDQVSTNSRISEEQRLYSNTVVNRTYTEIYEDIRQNGQAINKFDTIDPAEISFVRDPNNKWHYFMFVNGLVASRLSNGLDSLQDDDEVVFLKLYRNAFAYISYRNADLNLCRFKDTGQRFTIAKPWLVSMEYYKVGQTIKTKSTEMVYIPNFKYCTTDKVYEIAVLDTEETIDITKGGIYNTILQYRATPELASRIMKTPAGMLPRREGELVFFPYNRTSNLEGAQTQFSSLERYQEHYLDYVIASHNWSYLTPTIYKTYKVKRYIKISPFEDKIIESDLKTKFKIEQSILLSHNYFGYNPKFSGFSFVSEWEYENLLEENSLKITINYNQETPKIYTFKIKSNYLIEKNRQLEQTRKRALESQKEAEIQREIQAKINVLKEKLTKEQYFLVDLKPTKNSETYVFKNGIQAKTDIENVKFIKKMKKIKNFKIIISSVLMLILGINIISSIRKMMKK